MAFTLKPEQLLKQINTNDPKKVAQDLDASDPLSQFRDMFHIPKTPIGAQEIYFCGNSLGCQPKQTSKYIQEELEKWQNLGVKGHFCEHLPWMKYHEFLSEALANLVGAHQHEVVAMNSLTTNLHLLMVSLYRPTQQRYKILIEHNAFPSDHYAVGSQLEYHGFNQEDGIVLVKPKASQSIITLDDWATVLDLHGDEIALVLIPAVQYYTGQFFDIKTITELAHKKGCIVGVDAAHGVGNVPLELHDWQVDFAVWCHYKYCNSGPGAIGGAYLHEKHARNKDLPRFAGWWGHNKETRFLMQPPFDPIATAEGWQQSNAGIISKAMIRASMDIFKQAGWLSPIREKSELLTAFLETMLIKVFGNQIDIITPRDINQRGAQLSLQIKGSSSETKAIYNKLTEHGVTIDWREPGVVRAAPAPLYNSFMDVYHFCKILKGCF